MIERPINFSWRWCGRLLIVKLGRLNLQFSLANAYRPIKGTPEYFERLRSER